LPGPKAFRSSVEQAALGSIPQAIDEVLRSKGFRENFRPQATDSNGSKPGQNP